MRSFHAADGAAVSSGPSSNKMTAWQGSTHRPPPSLGLTYLLALPFLLPSSFFSPSALHQIFTQDRHSSALPSSLSHYDSRIADKLCRPERPQPPRRADPLERYRHLAQSRFAHRKSSRTRASQAMRMITNSTTVERALPLALPPLGRLLRAVPRTSPHRVKQ